MGWARSATALTMGGGPRILETCSAPSGSCAGNPSPRRGLGGLAMSGH